MRGGRRTRPAPGWATTRCTTRRSVLPGCRYHLGEAEVDGLRFQEGLNAVADQRRDRRQHHPRQVRDQVNYRFAPDKSPEQAKEYIRGVLAGYHVDGHRVAAGARPGLDHPAGGGVRRRGRR